MRIRKPTERWFEVPGDPDGASIKIKALSPGERFAIYDKAFKQTITYTDSGPKVRQDTDTGLDRIETAKAVIVDWKQMYDEKGKLLSCTPGNIVRVVNGIDGFMVFIRDCMKRLDYDLEAEKKDQEKNLPTT